jgi:hypothetical protein
LLITVSDEDKKSTIDAIPKELPYSVELVQPKESDPSKEVETIKATEKEAPAAPAVPVAPVSQRVR